MQLIDLKEQLTKKVTNPLYVFTGPEIAIMDIYVNKIAQVSGAKIKRVESVSAIFGKLQNNHFINSTTVYIIRNDKEYTNTQNAWENLNDKVTKGNNIVILIYDNIDKRSKFYKHYSNTIVEFNKLSSEVLAKYIKKEIGLPESYGVDLSDICDNDYSRILLECDKLTHLKNALKTDIIGAYNTAMNQKLIYVSPKDAIFTFVDVVCRRQISKVYSLYQELLAINESPLAVISVLYNNIRQMLLVQSAGGGDIVSRTGLTAWQVKMAKEKGNKYTIPELVKALRLIRETERGIKVGLIDQAIAVEYILVNIL